MHLERVELGKNMGLSDDKHVKPTELVTNYPVEHEEPSRLELNMVMELLKTGSTDEQHRLAQTLLEMVRKV